MKLIQNLLTPGENEIGLTIPEIKKRLYITWAIYSGLSLIILLDIIDTSKLGNFGELLTDTVTYGYIWGLPLYLCYLSIALPLQSNNFLYRLFQRMLFLGVNIGILFLIGLFLFYILSLSGISMSLVNW